MSYCETGFFSRWIMLQISEFSSFSSFCNLFELFMWPQLANTFIEWLHYAQEICIFFGEKYPQLYLFSELQYVQYSPCVLWLNFEVKINTLEVWIYVYSLSLYNLYPAMVAINYQFLYTVFTAQLVELNVYCIFPWEHFLCFIFTWIIFHFQSSTPLGQSYVAPGQGQESYRKWNASEQATRFEKEQFNRAKGQTLKRTSEVALFGVGNFYRQNICVFYEVVLQKWSIKNVALSSQL